jgi:hypothetical protein
MVEAKTVPGGGQAHFNVPFLLLPLEEYAWSIGVSQEAGESASRL